jgi:hypothetical protein
MLSDTVAASVILQRVVSLYEFALEIQEQARTPSPYFSMVTMNNLGHAQQMLGNKEKSKSCFDHLLSILMILIDSQSIDPTSMKIFFCNIFGDGTDVAAAA